MDGDRGVPVGRRVVLGVLGLGALGVVTGRSLLGAEQRVLATVGSRDPTGLSQLLVPAGAGFRFYSVAGPVRRRPAETYRVRVGGLVERPVALSVADLGRLPQAELVRDQCVTGWRVPEVRWTGVALPDLLDLVGVRPAATALRLVSYDGVYAESLSLDQAGRRDVLVATGLQGRSLSHAHGGPVRLAVTPMYGYKSLKWLDRIELTAAVEPGFWERRGYDVDGFVGRSNGRDDEPTG